MSMRKQYIQTFETLNDEEMKSVTEIINLLKANDKIRVHVGKDKCYTNLSYNIIQTTTNSEVFPPIKKYSELDTPNKIPLYHIVNDYIAENGKPFTGMPNAHIAMNCYDICVNNGDEVYCEGYLFIAKSNGSVIELYVNGTDYVNKTNRFCAARRRVFKIIPEENKENELELFKQKQIEAHDALANYDSSDYSD